MALVFVRHGQSTWNRENLFTGWSDPPLTEEGRAQAYRVGMFLAQCAFSFDKVFTSLLRRTHDTAAIILEELHSGLRPTMAQALNERDYGELSGMHKDEAMRKWGKAQVHAWRRSFFGVPPGGESLEMAMQRVVPYYEEYILPCVQRGEKVLVVAHGNSIRCLIMYVEDIDTGDIEDVEVEPAVPVFYRLEGERAVRDRERESVFHNSTVLM